MRYHFIPIGMAILKNVRHESSAEDVDKRKPYTLLWWNVNGKTTM